MATNEVLKFIVFAAGAISGGLGVLTGLIAFRYRKQVLKAERKLAQAQLRRFQKERRPDHPAVQDAQNAAPVI